MSCSVRQMGWIFLPKPVTADSAALGQGSIFFFRRPIRHPDKRPTQHIGIVPDVEVKPTLDGIRAGRGEVLEEALKQIHGSQTPEEEIRELARARE